MPFWGVPYQNQIGFNVEGIAVAFACARSERTHISNWAYTYIFQKAMVTDLVWSGRLSRYRTHDLARIKPFNDIDVFSVRFSPYSRQV